MSGLTVEGLVARQGAFTMGPVSFDVPPGSAVAVVGPSGAGKTTLLRAIAGFVPPAAGRVGVDSIDRTRSPPERRGAGYVPQGLGLFPHRTVRGNLRYPMEIRGNDDLEGRLERLERAWGLSEFARRRPHELSGGEQQRVAIARALAAEPRVLLWDEPLSAVDAVARGTLIELSRRVLDDQRVPLLLVTHDAETAFSVADRFLVLDAGRAAFVGSAEALFERPPNRFAARFIGFENVVLRDELASLGDPGLSGWLAERSGPGGLCWPAEAIRLEGSETSWSARVRRVRSLPGHLCIGLSVGDIEFTAVVPRARELAPMVKVGEAFRFTIDADRVRPIGATGGS